MIRKIAAIKALAFVTGCATASPLVTTPEPSSLDTQADKIAVGRQEAGSVLDVDRLQPQVKLASCEMQLPSNASEGNAKLEQAISEARAYSEQKHGTSFMIMKDGKVIHESYANGASKGSLTTSLSMMKSVLGLVLGIAIKDGYITSVGDPIGKYISEWRNDARGEITLEQLLTMSSGLEEPNLDNLLYGPDIDAVALSATLSGVPGESFYYNNAVSQIIGIALDRQLKAAGEGGFVNYLHERFWCPIGNGNARLWVSPSSKSPRYYVGMFASLEDWARIGELIRNNGKVNGKEVVPKDWLDAMRRPSSTNPRYGYHIWLGNSWSPERRYRPGGSVAIPHREKYEADDVVFFDGFGGQRVYVVSSYGITIVRTGFQDLTYDDSVIVNTLIRSLK